MTDFNYLLKIDIFKKSLSEQHAVLDDFWEKARLALEGSRVRLMPMPDALKEMKRNYFSTLFIAIFYHLKIPPQRLKLYARMNHCLRAWVTACDNLLDDELKEMILTDLPQQGRIFKSVHSLLIVDRIFFSFLLDALNQGVITVDEMKRLMGTSIASITESGIEEAEEEAGVDYAVSAEDVLLRVHEYKTGQLFIAPLHAPLALGDLEANDTVKRIQEGLRLFGLACQILDDLSDLGQDLYHRKHNYLASLIYNSDKRDEKDAIRDLLAQPADETLRDNIHLYRSFPDAAGLAQDKALSLFEGALDNLANAGFPLSGIARKMFFKTLYEILGHPDLLFRVRV